MGRKRGCLVLMMSALWCLAAAGSPLSASASVQTIDFESGPALGSPVDSAGDVSFPRGLGFRPYRVAVGARAHSGTTVGDVGRCLQEEEGTGGGAGGCEFFQASTTGQLARTASSVTLFAGAFNPPLGDPEKAVLTIFRANGSEIAHTAEVPIDAAGFDSELSLSSPAGDIASFQVKAVIDGPTQHADGGDLGIDDVQVDFADGADPDFSIATSNQVVALVQSQSVDVPVDLSRINGSSGPVRLRVSGLPKGVLATVAPNPVPGLGNRAVVTLSAALNAPDTAFVPTDATITAEPLAAAAGSAPRTATLSVRVATDFTLEIDGRGEDQATDFARMPVKAPDCVPVDLGLKIHRDIALAGQIHLSVRSDEDGLEGLAPGIQAEILPSPNVAAGGGAVAERTIRITAGPEAALDNLEKFLVVEATLGSGSHARVRQMFLDLTRATPQATIADSRPGSGLGLTPRFEQEGTAVRVHGSGFCPGTQVEAGNAESLVDARTVDQHTLEFHVPRLATTSKVRVIPPMPMRSYYTEDRLRVDSLRNVDGFQFENPAFGALSLSEMVEAFGADDMFISFNPCWPLGDCRINTGIVDPVAALEWGALNPLLSQTKGHCFGITLAVQRLTSGQESLRRFATGGKPARTIFELPGAERPRPDLESFLDAMHARQDSSEMIGAYLERPKSIRAQLSVLRREFAHHRMVALTLASGLASAHDVLAYDIEEQGDEILIDTYNSNYQFEPAEETPQGFHKALLERSTVFIDKTNWTWEMNERHGGNDGSLWAIPSGTVPNDPSLPELGSIKDLLEYATYDSPDGTVVSEPRTPGPQRMPVQNGEAIRDVGGTWVKKSDGKPLVIDYRGKREGSYDQTYLGRGFVATIRGIATARGVEDTLSGEGDAVRFDGGRARPLELKLAKREGAGETLTATLDARASAGGSDRAGIEGGALDLRPRGRPDLTALQLLQRPPCWRRSDLRLGAAAPRPRREPARRPRRSRPAPGAPHPPPRRRQLPHLDDAQPRPRPGPAADRAPRISGRRLTLGIRLSGFKGGAVAGAVLRLMRGSHLAAKKAISVRDAAGAHRLHWTLPSGVRPGRYRLLADVRAVAVGARGATAVGQVSARSAVRLRVAR